MDALGAAASSGEEAAGPPASAPAAVQPKRRRRRKKKKKTKGGKARAAAPPPTGEYPNIYWRTIPWEELRAHPRFTALEVPDAVRVTSVLDMGRFRQESWQWNAMHSGRLTTSKIATCLGFYEAVGAERLRVPRSLLSHGKVARALEELRSPPVSLEVLNADYDAARAAKAAKAASEGAERLRRAVWADAPLSKRFACGYKGRGMASNARRRRSNAPNTVVRTRMKWGLAQEPTALLATLNAFKDVGALRESGLCPLEAVRSTYDEDSIVRVAAELPLPPIGASPDGILDLSDGRIRAVELKNVAPYASSKSADGAGSFVVRDRGPSEGIAPWHVPQLMAEILCLGPRCDAALLVSMSATKGANVYRIQRDDEYIAQMLQLLSAFHLRYGIDGAAVADEGFAADFDGYADFLSRTVELAEGAQKMRRIHQQDVQRAPGTLGDLFLDRVADDADADGGGGGGSRTRPA